MMQFNSKSLTDSTILFYAFRYCLGRRTYCVDDFCEYATKKIKKIHTKFLYLIDREITQAQEDDENESTRIEGYSRLGDECDKKDWLKLREVIREELKARGGE